MTATNTLPPPPDADYDELVRVVAKLSVLLDNAVGAGHLPDPEVVFDRRERDVLAAAREAAA